MLAEGSARSFKAQVPMESGRGITLEVLQQKVHASSRLAYKSYSKHYQLC
jgi:hypothetical protein